MPAISNPVITEQEYLRQEEKSAVRHEFINGKMYEIPGGTRYHEHIIANTQFVLKLQKLKALSQGMRVRPPGTKNYFYPDVVVTNEKVTADTSIESPLLVAEVLSPSTRVKDSTDKFIWYRQIPALEYYLLVEANYCSVTLFYKGEDGEWESEVYTRLTDTISLPKLSAELPVAEIYGGVDWAEQNTNF